MTKPLTQDEQDYFREYGASQLDARQVRRLIPRLFATMDTLRAGWAKADVQASLSHLELADCGDALTLTEAALEYRDLPCLGPECTYVDGVMHHGPGCPTIAAEAQMLSEAGLADDAYSGEVAARSLRHVGYRVVPLLQIRP